MTNHFDSGGGGQNIAQGDHAIGKQENLRQEVRGDGNISSGTGNVTVNGIPPTLFAEYAGKLAVTESALASFFKIMEEQQVPLSDLDSKLREIATQYKALLARVGTNQAAQQAIEAGNYAKAEELLEEIARHHSLAAAEAHADNARLQRVRLRYAKAAEYWQKAAALLPEDKNKERANYLGKAGYDLHRIAEYKDALSLWEQSLAIRQEIGDKAEEGRLLNNISQIYKARGDYLAALKYLKQSLSISQKIGDRTGEDCTLNNISQIYHDREDYATALKYLKQSLSISQKIGDRTGEDCTLNNISQIYHDRGDYAAALKYLKQSLSIQRDIGNRYGKGVTLNNIAGIHRARGDYPTALNYLEQSLRITQEIGDKAGEAVTSWNIGMAYADQGDLAKAEQYMSRAVQLAEELGHPNLKDFHEGLEQVRAQLRGR